MCKPCCQATNLNVKIPRRYVTRKNIVYLIGLALIGYSAKLALNILLAHYLTPSHYGDFSIALRTLAVLSSAALIGTEYSSKRFMPYYLSVGDTKTLTDYIKWNLNITRITFPLCLVIAITSLIIMHALHIWHIKDIRTHHLSIYMLWIAPFSSIFALLGTYLSCTNHGLIYRIFNKTRNLVFMLIFILIINCFNVEIDSYLLVFVFFLSFFTLIILQLSFLKKKEPLIFTHIVNTYHSSQSHTIQKDWVIVSIRFVLNNFIFLLICSADLIIIKFISPDENSVGLYAAALTLTAAMLVIPKNIFAFLNSKVHPLSRSKEGREQLVAMTIHFNQISLFSMVVIGLFIIIFSKELLGYFGAIYLQAEYMLKILTFGFIIGAYSKSASTLLAYSNYEGLLLTISCVELVAIIVFGSLATYFYGIIGTASITAVVLALKTITMHSAVYYKLKLKSFMI
jgi:O-antigen/teichoic acid export membrane protein